MNFKYFMGIKVPIQTVEDVVSDVKVESLPLPIEDTAQPVLIETDASNMMPASEIDQSITDTNSLTNADSMSGDIPVVVTTQSLLSTSSPTDQDSSKSKAKKQKSKG